jgi:hypothetical protein
MDPRLRGDDGTKSVSLRVTIGSECAVTAKHHFFIERRPLDIAQRVRSLGALGDDMSGCLCATVCGSAEVRWEGCAETRDAEPSVAPGSPEISIGSAIGISERSRSASPRAPRDRTPTTSASVLEKRHRTRVRTPRRALQKRRPALFLRSGTDPRIFNQKPRLPRKLTFETLLTQINPRC